jgi:hypothetical protein
MTLAEDLALIGILVTALGSTAGVIGIIFVWNQVRASRRIAQGEFLLRLGELLMKHEPASRALTEGHWTSAEPNNKGVVQTESQWLPDESNNKGITLIEMIRYVEVFDQMNILIDYRMIEPAVFQRLFGYRLYFIVANDYIYQDQLMNNAQWWPDTIALCKLMATYPIVDGAENSIFKWQEFQNRVSKMPDVSVFTTRQKRMTNH